MVNQPGKEILFAYLASNLLKSGDMDKAIKLCEKGLKKFPTYAQAHYILARCYIKNKLNDEARAELERVLRYDPNHIKAIRDLAGLYFANGFQDLYKEYLMQLFTLDPINEKVIQEAKKLGEYKLWSPASKPEPTIDPGPVTEDKKEKENVFIDPQKEKTDTLEPDPIFPDKIDLSQFDNVEDDFTTILHGKLEYSGQMTQSDPGKDPDLADIAKDIIEQPASEDGTDSIQDKNQAKPTVDDPLKADNNIADDNTGTNMGFEGIESESENEQIDKEINNLAEKVSSQNLSQSSGSTSDEMLTDREPLDEGIENSDDIMDEEDGKFEQPKIISQTLGEILVSQQKYVEAKAVFEALKEKQPDNKALDLKIEYLDRIIGLEKKGKS